MRASDLVAGRVKQKFYYGWLVLAAAFFVQFIVSGAGFTFSLFILPMHEDLGWSITTITVAMSFRNLLSGIIQPFAGGLITRYGHKLIIIAGLLIMGLNTFFLNNLRYLWQFYLMFGIVATIGAGGAGFGPLTALVSRWFQRRRTLTIAIANTGMSAGQFIVVPLITFFVLPHGWRFTYMILGAAVLFLALPAALFFFKNDPTEVGRMPDGSLIPAEGAAATPAAGKPAAPVAAMASHLKKFTLRQAAQTRTFWLLAVSFFVCGFTAVGLQMVYLVPYAEREVGLSQEAAGIALGIMGGTGVFGILLAGYLGDRIGKKRPLAAVFIMRGLSFLLIMNATNQWHVFIAAAVMGLSFIATVPLVSSIVADKYGSLSVAVIFGTIFAVHQIGAFVGNILGGRIMDAWGSLYWGWLVGALMLVIAAVASSLVKEERAPKPVPAAAR